ncbi:MAG: FAD-binding protein, partial [Thermomicrobiales bacterium]
MPRGGGTAMAIGNAGSDSAVELDLTGLAGVTSYQPADLTVSLAAGTRVADLLATLAEQGQELPIDIALPSVATIGGLMATGFAGPRRLGSGTLKDLILGCTYVRGDGLVAKAGGSVVKNVSGFEIPRLLHGSWGSLAVITSINFKVTPIPKSEVTRHWSVDSIEMAVEQAQKIRHQFASVVSIEVDSSNGAASVLVRLMGRPGALAAQTEELGDLFGQATTIAGEESRLFWQSRVDRFATC